VLLAVPEYAFGIPGAFKNALDWTVGITAIDADAVFRSVPVTDADRDAGGEVCNPKVVAELRTIVSELAMRASAATAA
jgi:NAD(P)H-dependent FMN reductase